MKTYSLYTVRFESGLAVLVRASSTESAIRAALGTPIWSDAQRRPSLPDVSLVEARDADR